MAQITIHASQFPDSVRRDLLQSFRDRAVNHKFHYDSYKQTQKWLALHQAFAPSRRDPDCIAVYDQSFAQVAQQCRGLRVHLVGLGCGGGQKDRRCLEALKRAECELFYTPCDVSTAMVLVARNTAGEMVPESRCLPVVCDLAATEDWAAVFDGQTPPDAVRTVTFFGMIPNFEPSVAGKLAALLRAGDTLLFGANLAPGSDYPAGMQAVLPQYDNRLTRDWLLTFLWDIGFTPDDGGLRFAIEPDSAGGGLKRIAVYFDFHRRCDLVLDAERFEFCPGESIRLFFSYRYTPPLVTALLRRYGLEVRGQWVARSGEEGVFLCSKTPAAFPARP